MCTIYRERDYLNSLSFSFVELIGIGRFLTQPVEAGCGGKIEVIVTFARLQVLHALPDCPVGQAAYPQPDKRLVAA